MDSAAALRAKIRAENIGGIDETKVLLEPGITVLAGRNATNRTSLLRAIMCSLGSDRVSLKAGEDSGYVELEIEGETYKRELKSRNGTVVMDGDPYLADEDDVDTADLFAFLLESNEARQGVARQDDLHDILVRPIDTASIEREISKLVTRRDTIDDQLDELDDLSEELPELEQRRQELKDELEEVESNLTEKQHALDDLDESVKTRRQEQSELDDTMEKLETTRTDYTRTRRRLQTEQESITSLEEQHAELETELAELPDDIGIEDDIESELEDLRSRLDTLESELSDLQSIIQFNKQMLDGTTSNVVAALRDDGSPTDQLLANQEREIVCWTCGSDVEQAQLEETVERLRSLRSARMEERSDLRDQIEKLQEQRRKQKDLVSQQQTLERRIDQTQSELETRRERIKELEAKRDEFDERVDTLEAEVRKLQSEEQDELLDLNREVNELEFERDRLESDLESVKSNIDRIESRLDERLDLETKREEVSERLTDLRTRIDTIEMEAVDQFNEHMEQVLTILEYENLDRVWIERKQQNKESRFDLHVVRTTQDGTAFEDRIDHLSESEREVVGLVFALAGYLVHEVYDTVPFLLLDSLEALDSERIATLVEYFGGFVDSLVVALLPEDAAALDDSHQRITDI